MLASRYLTMAGILLDDSVREQFITEKQLWNARVPERSTWYTWPRRLILLPDREHEWMLRNTTRGIDHRIVYVVVVAVEIWRVNGVGEGVGKYMLSIYEFKGVRLAEDQSSYVQERGRKRLANLSRERRLKFSLRTWFRELPVAACDWSTRNVGNDQRPSYFLVRAHSRPPSLPINRLSGSCTRIRQIETAAPRSHRDETKSIPSWRYS